MSIPSFFLASLTILIRREAPAGEVQHRLLAPIERVRATGEMDDGTMGRSLDGHWMDGMDGCWSSRVASGNFIAVEYGPVDMVSFPIK